MAQGRCCLRKSIRAECRTADVCSAKMRAKRSRKSLQIAVSQSSATGNFTSTTKNVRTKKKRPLLIIQYLEMSSFDMELSMCSSSSWLMASHINGNINSNCCFVAMSVSEPRPSRLLSHGKSLARVYSLRRRVSHLHLRPERSRMGRRWAAGRRGRASHAKTHINAVLVSALINRT